MQLQKHISGDIFAGFHINLTFPNIGKGKAKAVHLIANAEDHIDAMVKAEIKRFTVDLIAAFHSSQVHRTANTLIAAKLNALSDLGAIIRTGGHKDARNLKMILADMEVLATSNTNSQFYRYDQDVIAYIRSLIPTPQNAVS